MVPEINTVSECKYNQLKFNISEAKFGVSHGRRNQVIQPHLSLISQARDIVFEKFWLVYI